MDTISHNLEEDLQSIGDNIIYKKEALNRSKKLPINSQIFTEAYEHFHLYITDYGLPLQSIKIVKNHLRKYKFTISCFDFAIMDERYEILMYMFYNLKKTYLIIDNLYSNLSIINQNMSMLKFLIKMGCQYDQFYLFQYLLPEKHPELKRFIESLN